MVARCLAGPSPYDVNPDEGNPTEEQQPSDGSDLLDRPLKMGTGGKVEMANTAVGTQGTRAHHTHMASSGCSLLCQGMDPEDSKV